MCLSDDLFDINYPKEKLNVSSGVLVITSKLTKILFKIIVHTYIYSAVDLEFMLKRIYSVYKDWGFEVSRRVLGC